MLVKGTEVMCRYAVERNVEGQMALVVDFAKRMEMAVEFGDQEEEDSEGRARDVEEGRLLCVQGGVKTLGWW